MADFLPRRDLALLGWAHNFRNRILESGASYGIDPQHAADFAEKVDAFAEAQRVMNSPSTRTRLATMQKDDTRRALEADARRLAAVARAHPGLSGVQLIQLRLTPRSNRGRKGRRPRTMPSLRVVSAENYSITLNVRNSESSPRGGRAAGLAGAAVFSYIGAEPPPRLAQWSLRGFATERTFRFRVETDTPAGSRIWITACWLTHALRRGTTCTPIATNIPGGVGAFLPARALAA